MYAIVDDGVAILPGQQIDVLIEADEAGPQAVSNRSGTDRTSSQ